MRIELNQCMEINLIARFEKGKERGGRGNKLCNFQLRQVVIRDYILKERRFRNVQRRK